MHSNVKVSTTRLGLILETNSHTVEMGKVAKIYVTIDKLQRDLQNREHMRLVDLERLVKTLKEVVSDFVELAAEATCSDLVKTTDLNS